MAFGTQFAARYFIMDEAANPGDRHVSHFLIRLPEVFRGKLRLLRARTGKPITQLVQSALKLFLKGFGLWRKQDERELQRQASPTRRNDAGQATDT